MYGITVDTYCVSHLEMYHGISTFFVFSSRQQLFKDNLACGTVVVAIDLNYM